MHPPLIVIAMESKESSAIKMNEFNKLEQFYCIQMIAVIQFPFQFFEHFVCVCVCAGENNRTE